MKRFLISVLMVLFLTIGLVAQNTITRGAGIIDEGGGWYSIPSANYYSVNWIIRYVRGDSTSITMTFAWACSDVGGPGLSRVISISDKSAANLAGDLTVIMDSNATRGFYLEIPKRAEKIYIHITFAAGIAGRVYLYGLLDYNQ